MYYLLNGIDGAKVRVESEILIVQGCRRRCFAVVLMGDEVGSQGEVPDSQGEAPVSHGVSMATGPGGTKGSWVGSGEMNTTEIQNDEVCIGAVQDLPEVQERVESLNVKQPEVLLISSVETEVVTVTEIETEIVTETEAEVVTEVERVTENTTLLLDAESSETVASTTPVMVDMVKEKEWLEILGSEL
ncbi:hypothetical protein F2Q69_00027335 [Brassica cretica]|uniref:Uncharacterized protein n=1 Tax=Brassica cretica TaxID=69181 RepID=A0A8S9S681_BRACR|nr:hypothetical protein F2Q69_00027335 [Brassica cretica]